MSYIHSIARAVPEKTVNQYESELLAKEIFKDSNLDLTRLLPVFSNAGIDSRPILMEKTWYSQSRTFTERNDLFLKYALELGKASGEKAIQEAGLKKEDIGAFIVITSSGFVTPTLDARLMDLMGLDSDTIRIPITGLGCSGGANSILRAWELSRVYPDKYILITAVETCTLTFRPNDKTKANLVALSLFSDGAASAVISGKEKKNSIQIISGRSRKWPDSLNVMGWDVRMDGLQVVFDKSIPDLIRQYYSDFYFEFLKSQNISKDSIEHFLFHPGGRKVIEAFQESLGLKKEDFYYSYKILREFGNISSPTVFFVIDEFLKEKKFQRGEGGAITAMGPGFSSDLLYFVTT